MTDVERARWMAMGYKTKVAMKKAHPDLEDFSLLKLSFGFYQWKQKNKPTGEQLELFEAGYKHTKS